MTFSSASSPRGIRDFDIDRLKNLEESYLNLKLIFDQEIGQENDFHLFDDKNFPKSKYVISNLITGRSSDSQLSVFHLNCQGLYSSFSDLESTCRELRPDCIGLCETFITQQTESLLDIPGYTSHFLHRKQMKRGGIAIYIRDTHTVQIRQDLTRNTEGIFESLFLEVWLSPNKKFIVGEIYRSPSGSTSQFMEHMAQVLELAQCKKNELILMGDFNINLSIPLTAEAADLLNNMAGSGLYPAVTIPTRVTESTHSLIDNIFSSLLPESVAVLVSDTSDHFPIHATLGLSEPAKIRSRINPMLPIICLTEENLKNLKQELEQLNWDNVMEIQDVNEAFGSFHSTFMDVYSRCCVRNPRTNKRKKDQPISPWMTDGLLACVNKKNHLWGEYRRFPSLARLEEYEQYRKVLRTVLRRAKRGYLQQKLTESGKDGRKVWQIINSVLRPTTKSSTLPAKLVVNDEEITEPTQVAASLSTFFANIGDTTANSVGIPSKSYKEYLGPKCMKSMAVSPVTPGELELLVKNLKGSSASGFDLVHTKALKAVVTTIAEPLTYLVNLSLDKGVFPEMLKKAKIIPLHKGGSHTDTENYRPISILSVFSKVFETPMKNQLYQYLEAKGFFNSRQFGFRAGHSTEDALTSLSLFVNRILDSGALPAAVLLDIKKAFDSMHHEILLGKLDHIGVRGQVLDWFKSYLENRRIYTGNDHTNDVVVNCGVPQGSKLGPVLFLVHVNDLQQVLTPASRSPYCCKLCHPQTTPGSIVEAEDELTAFADDSLMASSEWNIKSLKTKLQDILEETYLWMDANRLVINIDKSSVLFFSRIDSLAPDVIGIETSRGLIKRPEKGHVRYLGVLIDENLSFRHHIASVETKLSRNLGILRKLSHHFPKKILILIYNAVIKPHIQYCSTVWQSNFKTHLQRLNSVHNKALQILGPAPNRLSMASLYRLSCTVFCFKYFSGTLPSPFRGLFTLASQIHSLNTRSSSDIYIPPTPTARSEFSPRIACAREWNALPQELRSYRSLGSFKKNVKKYLKD